MRLRIVTINSFSTAVETASSAAAFACLMATLADFYGLLKIDEKFLGQLSTSAHGSGCRSLGSGFVAWQKGLWPDNHDFIAGQVADVLHCTECVLSCMQ